MLRALYPLSCQYRNFMLAYLIEANAVITFASTGVRGMKYDGHPLIGPSPRPAFCQACMRLLFFVPATLALDGRLTRAHMLVARMRRSFDPTGSQGESRAAAGGRSGRGSRERGTNVCTVLETVPRAEKPRRWQTGPGYAYRPRQAPSGRCLALSQQLMQRPSAEESHPQDCHSCKLGERFFRNCITRGRINEIFI